MIDHRKTVSDLHFSKDGDMQLLSSSFDGTLKLWDMEDEGNMYQTLKPGAHSLLRCAWSRDGTKVAAVGTEKTVILVTVISTVLILVNIYIIDC